MWRRMPLHLPLVSRLQYYRYYNIVNYMIDDSTYILFCNF